MDTTFVKRYTKNSFIYALSSTLLINLLLLCLGFYFGLIEYPSYLFITVLGFVVVIVTLLVYMSDRENHKYGFSAVVLFYTICTQFGLNTIYYFGNEKPFSNFNFQPSFYWFLYSDFYHDAVILSCIAIIAYVFGVKIGKTTKREFKSIKKNKIFSEPRYQLERKIALKIGYLLVFLVIVYFLFNLVSGQLWLGTTYTEYRRIMVSDNVLYGYIMVIYATSIGYLIAAGTPKEWKLALVLYSIPATFLFVTGNKGEVLYAALACIGILGYRGYKLKPKIIILLAIILFIIIPFVTSVRSDGVLHNLNKISFSFFDPFIEMGGQLRVTVSILEEFSLSGREYLLGFSYINPVVNIIDRFIPFYSLRLPLPESFNFKEVYARKGFNQVAESYANFGLLGVIAYHFIVGYLISTIERKKLSPLQLGFFASVVVVIINVTRNKFAFVPGQIFILLLLYLALKFIAEARVKRYE